MKVVIALPASAAALTAAEAAARIASGWRAVRPGDDLVLAPVSDGGAGTIDALAGVLDDAELVPQEVADACGRARQAAWLRLGDGRAVVEAARAAGVREQHAPGCDAMAATSYGVGQLVAGAVRGGAREIIVGCGGCAAVDGGSGLAIALGHRLLRADGNGVKVGGRWVRDLHTVAPGPSLGVRVTIALDTAAPLLGPGGAARLYEAHRGAEPEKVAWLEQGLGRFADVVERDLAGGPWRDEPGAGAGGGLGFGLLAFCEARARPGPEVIAEVGGFKAALRGAQVVITGEAEPARGSRAPDIDAFVADRARAAGAFVLAVTGGEDGSREPLGGRPPTGANAGRDAAALLEARGAELAASAG